MRTCIPIILAVAVLGCSGGSADKGSDLRQEDGTKHQQPLSQQECQQLIDKSARLGALDDIEAEARGFVRQERIEECADELTWDRQGYDCVMLAKTAAEFEKCAGLY